MRVLRLSSAAALTLTLAGCDAIGAIFRAGMWVGVIAVVMILVAVWFLISRFR